MAGLHAGILLTVEFDELTVGMLIAQLFVFDPRWIRVPSDVAVDTTTPKGGDAN